jgi:MFS family permease
MLPLYIISLGASVSAMSSSFAAMHIVSAIIRTPVGILSDRYDSRIFLAGGVILSAFSLLLSTVSRTAEPVFIALILSGIAGGLFYPVEQKAIAETASIEERSRAFAFMSLTWGLVGLSTPLAGGYLVERYGLHTPFLVGLLVSLLGIPLSLRVRIEPQEDRISEKALDDRNLGLKEKFMPVLVLAVTRFILMTALSLPWTLIAVYLKLRYGCGYLETGYYLTIMSLGSIIATPIAARIWTARDRRRSIILLMPIVGLIFIGLSSARSPLLVTALIFIMNTLGGICGTSINALTADISTKKELGLAYGVSSTALRLGISAGSYLGGYFADFFGFNVAFLLGTSISFLATLPAATLGRYLPVQENVGLKRT